jgi:hypothetical protein
MKPPSPRCSVLLVIGLLIAPSVGLAQNIASGFGASGQNLDRLTLLPGPGLLSPGRGQVNTVGPTALGVVRESSTSVSLPLRRAYTRATPGSLNLVPLRPSGVNPMIFEPPIPPAVPLARPTPLRPPAGDLRFDAKLPPIPAPTGKRD